LKASRIAIIPARGGSKGIPRKNIRMFDGKPLMCWVIDAALQSNMFEMVIVSTDDEEICEIAKSYGATVPFLRPKELAEDTSPTIDVIIDLLKVFPEFEVGTLLQPTSPLTTSTDIRKSIALMEKLKSDSLVSVVKTKSHPQLLFSLQQDMSMRPLSTESPVSRRQELPDVFALNGAIYNFSIPWLLEKRTLISDGTVGYEMSREKSIDIDDEFDWAMATWLHQSRKIELT
jgi:CMP-N,N'-diacetyllegionaminic acid synthase